MVNLANKTMSLALLSLVLVLQYQLWAGEGGIEDIWRLKRSIAVADIQNAEMAEQNTVVAADVVNLRQADEAVMDRARGTLGMVAKNETFYQIVD